VRRHVVLGLLGVVGVALALRLLTLGGPLSHDEGYSWLVASAPSGHAFLGRLAAYENTPPLFYLLLRPLPLDAAWSLRLPALVPGVLVVAVRPCSAR